MEVIIYRTSSFDGKPCEGAYKKSYTRIDERTTDAPEKVAFYAGKSAWWYEKGSNHRVENGHIKRDFVDFAWFILIDDIFEFVDKHDHVVVNRCFQNPSIWSVEIYDDYRE